MMQRRCEGSARLQQKQFKAMKGRGAKNMVVSGIHGFQATCKFKLCALAQMATKSQPQTQASSTSIKEKKKALRSRVRQILKSLDPHHRQRQDEAIQSFVLQSPWYKSSRRLCAYVSCHGLREVDTSKIISDIVQPSVSEMQAPKKLYVPRVEDKASNMRMLQITTVSDLVANSMNILEPASVDSAGRQREDVMKADEPVDFLLLPGLAFDCTGRRLGRGGGYYDNFLKSYLELSAQKGWQTPLLVALAYSEQILDEAIPVSGHDVVVDALVSPSGVLPISPLAAARM